MAQAAKGKTVRGTGVREAAAQETRDKILHAATKVFARYGYEGAASNGFRGWRSRMTG